MLSNQYDIRTWLRYLEAKRLDCLSEEKKSSVMSAVDWLYERALHLLPGSFKLWHLYLQHRQEACHSATNSPSLHLEIKFTVNVFKRASLCLPRMPRIWIDYLQFVQSWCRDLSLAREVVDGALAALPITQHVRIWDTLFEGLPLGPVQLKVPQFITSYFRRMCQLLPERRDAFIKYLKKINDWDGVACELFASLQALSSSLQSLKYKESNNEDTEENDDKDDKDDNEQESKWIQLCNVLLEHSHEIDSLDVPFLFRTALQVNRAHQGRFWTAFATFYLRRGQIGVARATFEEALQKVWLVRDFAQVFDSYAKMEETLVAIQIERLTRKKYKKEKVCNETLNTSVVDFEGLLRRHALLLNDVLLRQNPHSVPDWIKQSQLMPQQRIAVLEEAIKTVNPTKSLVSQLWIELATAVSSPKETEQVYQTALEDGRFANEEDLAAVLIAQAQFLRDSVPNSDYLEFIYSALRKPFTGKCLKLWNFLLDEEEGRGANAACQAVYDRLLQGKLAQPQHIINYALFCELVQGDLEAAFRVYERGIDLFGFPVAFEIWNVYLPKAVKFLGPAGRLERIRDLFETALQGCPAQFIRDVGLLYAAFEEDYGLGRNALVVLRRTCLMASPAHRPALFSLLAQKSVKQEGLLACREVYEAAIKAVDPVASIDFALKYTQLEEELGEVSRARALFLHTAPQCDPRTFAPFWEKWREFEVRSGDEASFREMLRVKRAIQAAFAERLPFVKAKEAINDDSIITDTEVQNDEEIQLDL